MLNIKSFLLAGALCCVLLAGTCFQLAAQKPDSRTALTFKQGERIVFLGGSLFENELEKSYLEFAMTTRWPDLDLTFRNLGWTGDNVFAEARSTFTTPPTPYQQLFQQLRSTDPDLVLIAYGGVESQEGTAGLSRFVSGLEAIIDSVDVLGAQTILLSTIPVKLAGNQENTVIQNNNLKQYADAISAVASKRKKRYIDLYSPIAEARGDLFLGNGIHLNDAGYYYLAQVLEQAFGWPPRASVVTVELANAIPTVSGPAKIISAKEGHITFSIQEPVLPLPVTAPGKPGSKAPLSIQLKGLKNGRYVLTENGQQVATASAAEWGSGVAVYDEKSQAQSVSIRDNMIRKNNLFFQQYRPMNRTYILGFRSYEQGRHKQGLEDLNPLISGLEEQIKQARKPALKTYELKPSSNN